jgi:MoxR-like ATPase
VSLSTAPTTTADVRATLAEIHAGFEATGYLCSDPIATALFLATRLEKPVLIEGPPGVGKTELARATATWLGKPLIRLQCYEGLDESKALYEWKYGKQLLYTQVLKDKLGDLMEGARGLAESIARLHEFDDTFFNTEFLEPRPLLKALWEPAGAVLLIDEIDKSDEEFEALLLEILSDYQVTIPEIGTIEAKVPPLVILTSNNTRELGDALKRRCLHLHIGFPEASREREIVRSRVPEISESLLRQLVAFVQSVRDENIRKLPSISETVDWARTLMLLHADLLDPALVRDTLNVILKRQGDITEVQGKVEQLTAAALAEGQAAG